MKQQQLSWAIKTDYIDFDGKSYPGFIGRYWRFRDEPPDSRESHVLRVRLFETRAAARKAQRELRMGYCPYAKTRVVRVTVTVEESVQ